MDRNSWEDTKNIAAVANISTEVREQSLAITRWLHYGGVATYYNGDILSLLAHGMQ